MMFQTKLSLLFLYREVLEIEFGDFRNTIRAKQRTRIPVVLSKEEIRELFSHVSGIHALILKLIYVGGMRSHPPAFLYHALASGRI
ncbi:MULTISPECIES: hypothetical protein [Desulfotignum]|jgi:integrase|uniref:Integrase n=1 Tax=Desulfotignum phosphitoxidans DSM 13687 TaxID=1286635 RepID=S0FUT6_9BACT|nr:MULTISPECIES: hypothetical protein [Desulfotignum]EMS78858.1 integrase [Desulfotignum phosphitoxidans DSM 13687]